MKESRSKRPDFPVYARARQIGLILLGQTPTRIEEEWNEHKKKYQHVFWFNRETAGPIVKAWSKIDEAMTAHEDSGDELTPDYLADLSWRLFDEMQQGVAQ